MGPGQLCGHMRLLWSLYQGKHADEYRAPLGMFLSL
jgi:hypothetical protein